MIKDENTSSIFCVIIYHRIERYEAFHMTDLKPPRKSYAPTSMALF